VDTHHADRRLHIGLLLLGDGSGDHALLGLSAFLVTAIGTRLFRGHFLGLFYLDGN
jgi:hypothetical protein